MQAVKPHHGDRDGLGRSKESPNGPSQRRSDSLSERLAYVCAPVQDGLQRVKQNLRTLGREQSPFLSQFLEYVLDTTGKRVRPALTLLAARFHPNDGRKAEIMASAVELIHIAALIHDDFLDKSSVRRGRPTVSSLWGRNAAVLLGDYALAAAATLVCQTANLGTVRRFSETSVQLSAGEMGELAGAYNSGHTREQYMYRIYAKTASLFSAAAEAGAVLSGAPERTVGALRDYGYNLGMAFQIIDDILDFDGTREEVGKPVGHDLAQGIMTLPAILAIERWPEDNPIPKLFRRPGSEDRLERAVGMIQDSSVIDESHAIADEFCGAALRSLTTLEHNRSRQSLKELVSYVVARRS